MPQKKVAGSGPRRHPPQTLLHPHRTILRPLVQTLHPFSLKRHPSEMGTPEVEQCRTHLAVEQNNVHKLFAENSRLIFGYPKGSTCLPENQW